MNSPGRQPEALRSGHGPAAGHTASRRSLASSRSGLARCRRPKLLSGGSGRPSCDLNAGGGAHWPQRVRRRARRASRAGSPSRPRRGSVKVSAVVLHAKVAASPSSPTRRQRAKGGPAAVGGSETTRAVAHAPSRTVFLPDGASAPAAAYR